MQDATPPDLPGSEAASAPEAADADRPAVSACETCADRVVFIEDENTDGWIAADLTVEVRR